MTGSGGVGGSKVERPMPGTGPIGTRGITHNSEIFLSGGGRGRQPGHAAAADTNDDDRMESI
jgi:hypothetical protein